MAGWKVDRKLFLCKTCAACLSYGLPRLCVWQSLSWKPDLLYSPSLQHEDSSSSGSAGRLELGYLEDERVRVLSRIDELKNRLMELEQQLQESKQEVQKHRKSWNVVWLQSKPSKLEVQCRRYNVHRAVKKSWIQVTVALSLLQQSRSVQFVPIRTVIFVFPLSELLDGTNGTTPFWPISYLSFTPLLRYPGHWSDTKRWN